MKQVKFSIYFFIILFIFSGCSFAKTNISTNNVDTSSVSENISKKPDITSKSGNPVHQGQKIPKSVSETQSAVKLKSVAKTEADKDISYNYSASNYEQFYSAIYESLKNFNSSSDIKITNYNENTYNLNVVNTVLDKHYEVDYGLDSVSASIYKTGSGCDIMHIEYTYKFPKSKMTSMRDASEKKAKEIVSSIISDGMTDLQKELAIHDYIVNSTKYDFTNYVNGTLADEAFTDYGALVLHSAVCSGYSKAFYRMLKLAGLENYIIKGYGDGVLHAWNIVKADGRYYHVDVTWDDPVSSTDTLTYDYFNLTDSQIAKDHTWNKEAYVTCN